jgi:hypothetical protein
MLLLNALPNSFMPTAGQSLVIQGITEQYATELLQGEFNSYVGHQSFAQVLSERTGVSIPVHRGQAPSPMDAFGAKALVAMVQPPRRLGEGEAWTEAEILSMPITWVLVKSATTDQAERV